MPGASSDCRGEQHRPPKPCWGAGHRDAPCGTRGWGGPPGPGAVGCCGDAMGCCGDALVCCGDAVGAVGTVGRPHGGVDGRWQCCTGAALAPGCGASRQVAAVMNCSAQSPGLLAAPRSLRALGSRSGSRGSGPAASPAARSWHGRAGGERAPAPSPCSEGAGGGRGSSEDTGRVVCASHGCVGPLGTAGAREVPAKSFHPFRNKGFSVVPGWPAQPCSRT